MVDYIIPTCYEYAEGYRDNPKMLPAIPMAINTDNISYKENIVGEKVVIFHGLNREVAKGTKYIREAMKNISDKYGDEVETIIDGHLPFNEYIQLLDRTNVIIDVLSNI